MSIIGNTYFKNVLEILKSSDFKFFLTGSRFFDTCTAHSDYDFFTQDTNDVRTFLKVLLFKEHHNYNYSHLDLLTNTVLKLDPSIEFPVSIDIQLVSNASLKSEVQDTIKTFNLLTNIDKNFHYHIWNNIIESFKKEI